MRVIELSDFASGFDDVMNTIQITLSDEKVTLSMYKWSTSFIQVVVDTWSVILSQRGQELIIATLWSPTHVSNHT